MGHQVPVHDSSWSCSGHGQHRLLHTTTLVSRNTVKSRSRLLGNHHRWSSRNGCWHCRRNSRMQCWEGRCRWCRRQRHSWLQKCRGLGNGSLKSSGLRYSWLLESNWGRSNWSTFCHSMLKSIFALLFRRDYSRGWGRIHTEVKLRHPRSWSSRSSFIKEIFCQKVKIQSISRCRSSFIRQSRPPRMVDGGCLHWCIVSGSEARK
mmetsp:Transcript_12192/g.28235  ORF Transcript_12192/g.28235 Transcript_12192/m.28235 type:complete len:205 (-) Transcript_12192:109-723(-)